MDIHNGTITIQSVPGQGTTVILRFPGESRQTEHPSSNVSNKIVTAL
jgi:hypothetical protein